ncbi:MAG: hypothetical protein PF574_04605 [Candidatus Delongbacteria bacterium]|jgi:hypothetical protein|nr:hypothetical protein [Candidatus Delongbacteria bacterium]
MNLIKILSILALLSITYFTYSQDRPRNIQYNNEKLSVAENGVKSLFIPGWGNPRRRSFYKGIEIIGWSGVGIAFIVGNIAGNSEAQWGAIGILITSGSLIITNHIIAPIDALITTGYLNSKLKKKYNISISPTYNPKNNGIGLGFAMNF